MDSEFSLFGYHLTVWIADQLHCSAFKFLPILGHYMTLAIKKQLPPSLAQRWRLRKEYESQKNSYKGDGSRGGPIRRELEPQERAKL